MYRPSPYKTLRFSPGQLCHAGVCSILLGKVACIAISHHAYHGCINHTYRQFPTGALQTEQYIGQGISSLLALVPTLDDGGHLIRPRHVNWAARLVDDHRAGVRLDNRLNEPILTTVDGQVHSLT